jgi:hypothetical protein
MTIKLVGQLNGLMNSAFYKNQKADIEMIQYRLLIIFTCIE